MQTINCRNCGKKAIVKQNAKYCSTDCQVSWFFFRRMIVSNNENYTKWREAVVKKNKNICHKCGKRGKGLHVHHIKQLMVIMKELREKFHSEVDINIVNNYAPLWDVKNGMVLCEKCHCNIGHKKD